MKLAEVPPLWQEAAQLWSRHALVGSDQEPLLLPGLHVVLLLMDSLITVDNLSYRGISRHGGCFCLLVRARTGALLSEKAVGSAPPVDAAPLADARAPLSAPRSDTSLSPQPNCAASSWEWGYRGRMVFPQPGSSRQLIRDFFFLVLAVTGPMRLMSSHRSTGSSALELPTVPQCGRRWRDWERGKPSFLLV